MSGNNIAATPVVFDYIRAHACHCIGCCAKCGQCRTDPRHAAVCDDVARLNAERERLYRQAS